MMNMKRFAAAALALCMMLCLCACGGSDENNQETTEAPVETTAAVAETEASIQEETTAAADTYKVTVVDEAGNPIAGAMVQLCLDSCVPGITNESGIAEYAVEEADYKVSFMVMPTGYTYTTEEQEFYFEDGSKEMTITLKAEG